MNRNSSASCRSSSALQPLGSGSVVDHIPTLRTTQRLSLTFKSFVAQPFSFHLHRRGRTVGRRRNLRSPDARRAHAMLDEPRRCIANSSLLLPSFNFESARLTFPCKMCGSIPSIGEPLSLPIREGVRTRAREREEYVEQYFEYVSNAPLGH